jgi:hypothetical protein
VFRNNSLDDCQTQTRSAPFGGKIRLKSFWKSAGEIPLPLSDTSATIKSRAAS